MASACSRAAPAPAATAAVDSGTLLQLHMPRTLLELRQMMEQLLVRLLPDASIAVLIEDQNDGMLAVELAHGADCPLVQDARVTPSAWQAPGLQHHRLTYRGLAIGELIVRHESNTEALPWLRPVLDHYAAAIANLKLDSAALAMVDHYCAGLQAFEEGVVLFQEKDRDVTSARFLQLATSLLRANHAALVTYAHIGDPTSALTIDQVLGLPDNFVEELRAQDDWWPRTQVDRAVTLHRRGVDASFPRAPGDGPIAAVQNVVSCPLRYHSITAGVALIFNVDADDPEIALKLATLRGLGELGAALLHRIQLEREAVFAKELETQLAIAATIQARLLPTDPPSNRQWRYAWRSRPSQRIGGDYLDLFDGAEGTVHAVIADVSGHGVNSALLMMSARAHFRAVASHLSPANALARLNLEVLHEVGATGMFVTGAVVRLAEDGRSICFASAGHNPVFLFRRATRSFEHLESSGPPLGFVREPGYQDAEVAVAPGDVIVLYSDGITEATDPTHEEMFGEERLAAAIAATADRDVDAILTHVLSAADLFTGRAGSFEDDASVMVLKA